MTVATPSASGSNERTTTSRIVPANGARGVVFTGTSSATVVTAEIDDAPSPAPEGYVTVDAVIAKHMANPARADAMARARQRLAGVADLGVQTVRAIRLNRGLSQVALGRMMGTSQAHVARLEKGGGNVTLPVLRKLCSALGVDMNTMTDALEASEAMSNARSAG